MNQLGPAVLARGSSGNLEPPTPRSFRLIREADGPRQLGEEGCSVAVDAGTRLPGLLYWKDPSPAFAQW